MLFASNTFRNTGIVLALVVLVGFLLYVAWNYVRGRDEVGAELELAPNKKEYLDDEELETSKLDLSLTLGLAMLGVIALALPLYWLGEPGRQEGYVDITNDQLEGRGEEEFAALCSSCHGNEGVGGVAPFTVFDDEGRFVANVSWNAPALNNVLYRFSEEEVRYVLNFGRAPSPMAAWGAPGGGPLTTQQIDELVLYLAEIQLEPEEVRAQVDEGLAQAARFEVLEVDPDLADDPEALDAAVLDYVENASQVELGELVFNNPIASGAYACARCHTAGWSWDANGEAQNPEQPFRALIPLEVSGGGGFGPNLTGGSELRQFTTAQEQSDFVSVGSQTGVPYGNFGQGDGGGQMPAYGVCAADRDSNEFSPISGFCEVVDEEGVVDERGGLLTPEQIDAVVAYERDL